MFIIIINNDYTIVINILLWYTIDDDIVILIYINILLYCYNNINILVQ